MAYTLLFGRLTCVAQDGMPMEKVYVHFDSNFYYAGDTIWYAAYTVRADDHRPTDISRILYVELLNEQGYQVERQQLVVGYDGRSNGQFALPDTAFAGYYEVRAYTKWMMNFRDGDGLPCMFSRVMPVYQRNDSTQNYRRKMMPRKITAGNYEIKYPLPKLNVKFYPEGGHIVRGQECRVAFEVSNEQTRRLDIEGELLEDGKVIDTIRTTHNGRGVFTLFALSGKKYKTRFTLAGDVYENEIEGIDEEGIAMKVVNGESMVDVTLSWSEWLRVGDCVVVRVLCRGELLMENRLRMDDGIREAHFPKERMKEGVNEVVVTDGEGNVMLSRMVFIGNGNATCVSPRVQGESVVMKPYERRTLSLDLGLKYADATFSLAVTDEGQRNQSYDTGNIMTELLLQSDIRGYVDDAKWYFEADDDEHRKALDLLMMVQGWSKYDRGITKREELKYQPEKSMAFGFELIDVNKTVWNSKRMRGEKVAFASLLLKDNTVSDKWTGDGTYLLKGSIVADSCGRFTVNCPPFYGDAVLQVSAFFSERLRTSLSYAKMLHDPHIFIKMDTFHPLYALKQYSWYETNQPDSVSDTPYMVNTLMLDNVTVTASKNSRISRKDQPVRAYEFNDYMNEFWDYSKHVPFNTQDKLLVFDNQEYDFKAFNRYISNVMMRYENVHQPVPLSIRSTVVLDKSSQPLLQTKDSKSREESYRFLQRIDSVKIISDLPVRPTYYRYDYPVFYIGLANTPTVNIGYIQYTKKPNGEERFVNGRYINVHGFSRPAEFYSPDYSQMPLPEQADHRHTLYWNPAVRADSQGQARVTFSNNSVCTDLHISVEGITKDGKMIVY